MNDKEPVTRGEFKEFVNNDFKHIEKDVGELRRAVIFIKGQLWILIPLVICLLGAMLTVLLRNIL